MALQQRIAIRSPLAAAAIALLLVAALAAGIFYGMNWRTKMRSQPAQGDGPRFAWLSQALQACEAEAARYPQGLYFMVVPLAAASPAAAEQIRPRALETVGPVTLLESKVALEGLESGALRISSAQFILHAMDVETNAIHRWNSVTGVSTLSERASDSKGPFKVRLQTAPGDDTQWSMSLAEGLATCHWVFALLRG
jgi:hypothetical protein